MTLVADWAHDSKRTVHVVRVDGRHSSAPSRLVGSHRAFVGMIDSSGRATNRHGDKLAWLSRCFVRSLLAAATFRKSSRSLTSTHTHMRSPVTRNATLCNLGQQRGARQLG